MAVTDKILNLTGLSWQELVAKGFARLVNELDSDTTKFEVLDDGIRISIVCDEDEKREAAKLWKEEIQPELDGGE